MHACTHPQTHWVQASQFCSKESIHELIQDNIYFIDCIISLLSHWHSFIMELYKTYVLSINASLKSKDRTKKKGVCIREDISKQAHKLCIIRWSKAFKSYKVIRSKKHSGRILSAKEWGGMAFTWSSNSQIVY